MPFGYGAAVVLSGSMEPALSTDDLIFVRKTGDLKAGNIIVYQDRAQLVVHRIIALDENTVRTKGDANQAADLPVDRSQVKGTVIGHIPWAGRLVSALQTPAAIFGILIAAIALIEWSYRREKACADRQQQRIRSEIERLKQEKDRDQK